MKSYFDEVLEKLDSLTSEEFMLLLKESGLENCPFEFEKEYSYLYETNKKSIILPSVSLKYSAQEGYDEYTVEGKDAAA